MKKQPKAVYIIENGGYTELTYEEFRRREQICPLYADKLFLPLYRKKRYLVFCCSKRFVPSEARGACRASSPKRRRCRIQRGGDGAAVKNIICAPSSIIDV